MDRRQNFQGGNPPSAPPPLSDKDLRAIIVDGDPEALVNAAKQIGRTLYEKNLPTSQIRNFFGAVREIEMNWPVGSESQREGDAQREKEARRKLLLLKPKLAYYVGKEKGSSKAALDHLEKVLSPAIDLAKDDRTRFANFVEFFEAILAYHKYHGGREQ